MYSNNLINDWIFHMARFLKFVLQVSLGIATLGASACMPAHIGNFRDGIAGVFPGGFKLLCHKAP